MSSSSKSRSSLSDEESSELRRGPWTLEEDSLLSHYVSCHGEGRWNLLAKRSGLRRTGKSCRLRWLNYLKPDVKRGNLTPEEQLLILQIHSQWGNRWSKIAQHLPGRTDNEIKNYWRTRVQKQARNLKMDSNSAAFEEVIRSLWIPRLLQKIQEQRSSPSPNCSSIMVSENLAALGQHPQTNQQNFLHGDRNETVSAFDHCCSSKLSSSSDCCTSPNITVCSNNSEWLNVIYAPPPPNPEYPTSHYSSPTTFLDGCSSYNMEAINPLESPVIGGFHWNESNWIENDELPPQSLWNMDQFDN
ncbi:hypothetical protein NMG60_11002349 [Bertholletia excelsa]